MKTVKYAGLGLCFTGLAALACSLLLSHYRITAEGFNTVISDPARLEVLRPALQDMLGKEYESVFAFRQDYLERFREVNAAYKASGKWDQVIYTDYTFPLVKAALRGPVKDRPWLWFLLCFILPAAGGLMYIIPAYGFALPGIRNEGVFHHPLTSRKWAGLLTAAFFTGFYVTLYWYPSLIAAWISVLDPLSRLLNGGGATQWFLYGFLYCLVMLVMGVRMFLKYRHNRYQMLRTASVLCFQLVFAFLIPQFLISMRLPAADLKNIWPLDYSFFFDYRLDEMIGKGTVGLWMLGWGLALFVLAVPLMTYFFGKRWYCSWVCGCGGLAETLGDPFRQLSSKTLWAWKAERIMIHSVLLFALLMTASVIYTYVSGESNILWINSYDLRSWYGFMIGSVFAGVIGTGFYPVLGNRTWCRFGCPLAACLGIVQRFFSRFRITTNGGQCISCGNCSVYCEMGIDVRAYAQKGQNIVRASCVGCGICAAVCPRGVLRLENKPVKNRFPEPVFLPGNKLHQQRKH